jgi:hypothetical protein
MSILAVFALMFPPIDSFEQAEQRTQKGKSEQQPVVGALAEP